LPRPIGVVQKPGLFEDLLVRLGVNRPGQPFMLDGDIVPVVLVESGVAFVAAPTPAYGVTDIFTIGTQVTPAIGTNLADTGPLPVGDYTVKVIFYSNSFGSIQFQWRDAPNTASLWQMELQNSHGVGGSPAQFVMDFRIRVENANERFRVLTLSASAAGQRYQASILARI